jgi:peptidoglycan/LPS O-acetylase OafA/YrhL
VLSSIRESVTHLERRVQGIDVLRGLCILAVVIHHINLRLSFDKTGPGRLMGPAANRVLFWSGYYGVRVFFVISGFLIAGWSLKRWGKLNSIDLRSFYVMRFARIVPCLAALLGLLSILHLAALPQFIINPQRASLARALVAGTTFHVNWLEAHHGYLPAGWDVLWSLSVEEVFYIVFPLLCLFFRKQRAIVVLLCSFAIIGPYARVHAFNDIWAEYGYLSGMDGIAFGCLAAILAANRRLSARPNLLVRISGISLCLLIEVFRETAARIGFYKAGLDVTMLQMGTALLVVALQLKSESEVASSNPPTIFESAKKILRRGTAFLRWYGRNSYEVYLTHMLVVWPMVLLYWRLHLGAGMAPLWFLATTALSGIAGHAVARFYSEPLNQKLRWKLRRPPVKAAATVASD